MTQYHRSNEQKTKIPPDFGVGLKFIDNDGEECISVCRELPQKAHLEVTNLLFSIGAVHFYCKIEVYSKPHKIIKTGEVKGTGGYGDKNKPVEMLSHSWEIVRKVTKQDRTHARRFGGEIPIYLKGRDAHTNGFWTEEEAQQAGIAFFKKWFDGWILEGNVLSGENEGDLIILAQT